MVNCHSLDSSILTSFCDPCNLDSHRQFHTWDNVTLVVGNIKDSVSFVFGLLLNHRKQQNYKISEDSSMQFFAFYQTRFRLHLAFPHLQNTDDSLVYMDTDKVISLFLMKLQLLY